MTRRNETFQVGNWYHCYNRSIEKRTAFEDTADYRRFLELLYLANDDSPLRRHDISVSRFEDIFSVPRGERLVAVGAFCLMPGHFHLALKEEVEGGITSFMRKLGTAYTTYFNGRHKRVGNLFLKPFRSTGVSSDRHLHHLISYVHTNPTILYEPEWKSGHVVDHQYVAEHLAAYPYSSLGAHQGARTPQRAIVDSAVLSAPRALTIQKMLQEAREYSAGLDIP